METCCSTENSKTSCCCPCHKMNGILLAFIGIAFLLGNLEVISAKVLGITWPILVILLGLKNMCSGKCKCCSKTDSTNPGTLT